MPRRRSGLIGPLVLAFCFAGTLLPASLLPSSSQATHAAVRRAQRPRLIQRVLFGAFVAESPQNTMVNDPTQLRDYERLLGAHVQVASYYYGVGDVFPGQREINFADGGQRAVLLSWDMGSTSKYRFSAWASGRYDTYLRKIGRAAAGYPYQIYVRPWPEMNADWVPFQPTTSGSKPAGGTPAQFIRAWRHVVTTVRSAGGTNIRWVFDPTVDVYPQTTDVRRIWPGAAWVDVLGLDGFNWGNRPTWRSFSNLFATQYSRLTGLAAKLPVWVCEFGSKEPTENDGAPIDPAHNKGTWLSDAFNDRRFPRIQALVQFDVRKERDWRFASSAGALRAARTAMASRPAPSTVRGVAALGVAGLPPTLREDGAGRTVVSWGRTQDPSTVRYQVQLRKRPNGAWTGAATTKRLTWTASKRPTWSQVRVRGLSARNTARWSSLPCVRH